MVMASNPHRFIIDNIDFLGTSGKIIFKKIKAFRLKCKKFYGVERCV